MAQQSFGRRQLVSVLIAAWCVHVDAQEPLMTIQPNPATTEEPLVVTVAATEVFCRLTEPVFLADMVIVIPATGFCDPPLLNTDLHLLIPPLPPGQWELQLNAADLPVNYPNAVVATVLVTVNDVDFSIELTPPQATEDQQVTARINGIAECPVLRSADIQPSRIVLTVDQLCTDGSSQGPSPFVLEQSLAPLAPDTYLVELFLDQSRVAESALEVLTSGSCLANDSTLCLNGNRFRVNTTWTTQEAASGTGQAVMESESAGFFWFFSPENIEVVVKVLDACETPFDSYWVFAAGLTDVGVDLEVTDTVTGVTVQYRSPVGSKFETITDTAAFPTCTDE